MRLYDSIFYIPDNNIEIWKWYCYSSTSDFPLEKIDILRSCGEIFVHPLMETPFSLFTNLCYDINLV